MGKLDNKTAIITGASRGIGKAIALRLASEGAKLVLTARSEAGVQKTADEIEQNGGEAIAKSVDVSLAAEVNALVKATVDRFGAIDILVNNAGITRDNIVMRMSDDEWNAVLATNLTGVFNLIRAASRPMMKKRAGKIINITSVVAQIGNKGQANYCSAKAGVIGLTKSVARELASRNIQVNAIAPGFIETDMTAALSDEMKKNLVETIPLQRMGTPDDIANLASFLASEESNYITGQVFNVDGGMVMS